VAIKRNEPLKNHYDCMELTYLSPKTKSRGTWLFLKESSKFHYGKEVIKFKRRFNFQYSFSVYYSQEICHYYIVSANGNNTLKEVIIKDPKVYQNHSVFYAAESYLIFNNEYEILIGSHDMCVDAIRQNRRRNSMCSTDNELYYLGIFSE